MENERQCQFCKCVTNAKIRECCAAGKFFDRSAPPLPVEGGPLLTLAEAVDALQSGKRVEVLDGENWSEIHFRDDVLCYGSRETGPKIEVNLTIAFVAAQFRLKPKPAPALGRCRERAKEVAGEFMGNVSANEVTLAGEFQRVAKEVLDRLRATVGSVPGMTFDRCVDDIEREYLGPSVPAQGADAQDQDR